MSRFIEAVDMQVAQCQHVPAVEVQTRQVLMGPLEKSFALQSAVWEDSREYSTQP
jgi:hypothetical protein